LFPVHRKRLHDFMAGLQGPATRNPCPLAPGLPTHYICCMDNRPSHSFNASDTVALTEQLLAAVRRQFGSDEKRIAHAGQVLEHARTIHAAEPGDDAVVIAAALLHDIGIQEAERKHSSCAGVYQELEGPPIAKGILEEIGFDPERTEHICRIVAGHHTGRGGIDTPEFRILWDADWMVNFPEVFGKLTTEQRMSRIEKMFRTETGKKMAKALFSEQREITHETKTSRGTR
jgi:hypothetical protein